MTTRENALGRAAVAALGALALQALVAGHASAAAILTGSYNGAPSSPVDLTSAGTTDWAIWDYQSGGVGSSGTPTNYKTGVTYTNYVSKVTTVDSGSTRGTTNTATSVGFTYTDGATTPSATNTPIGAILDTNLATSGSGITFTLTGDPGQLETAQIYVAGNNGTGTFSAALNGATTYSDARSYTGARAPALYTLNFQPASAGDKLTVTFTLSNPVQNGYGNVDLQAVAISVPEPASVGLLGACAAGLLARRRRV